MGPRENEVGFTGYSYHLNFVLLHSQFIRFHHLSKRVLLHCISHLPPLTSENNFYLVILLISRCTQYPHVVGGDLCTKPVGVSTYRAAIAIKKYMIWSDKSFLNFCRNPGNNNIFVLIEPIFILNALYMDKKKHENKKNL